MNEKEKCELIERYIQAYNSFDVDGMMATVHPEVEFTNISGGEISASASGDVELRQLAEQGTKLFSSRCQTVTSYEFHAKGVWVTIVYEGILASDLPNGMKAGEKLKLDGRSEFEFTAGKISRIVDHS